MEFHHKINNELKFELIQITQNNIAVFRQSIDKQVALSRLLHEYLMSYDRYNEEFTNKTSLQDILKMLLPNMEIKPEYADKLDKYFQKKALESEYFQIQYMDLASTIFDLKRTLDPKYDILSKCDNFFLGMILKNDDPIICMSVRADKDFKNTIHMYIFRSVFTMLGDIIFDNPRTSNLAVALHSLCTYTIYKNFPNGLGYITVWTEPLDYMKELLSKYVKFNQNGEISLCGMRLSMNFKADEEFMLLWKQLV